MPEVDVLVCGAGIAGASIAAELARSARVVIAEREDVAGYHTTGRSAALYIASYGNAAVRALTAASRADFDDPPSGFAEHPLLTPRGCLHIARSGQTGRLAALADELAVTGVEVRRLSGDEARALAPVLRDDIVAALLEPAAADIDVAALHHGYLRLARLHGVELRLSAALMATTRAGGVWRCALADGTEVEARTVVNAAGAWADQVAILAGAAPLGLVPCRRTALILEPPAGAECDAWPAVIDVDEQFYFKPEAGKILASPADETECEPCDAAPEELDIAVCVDRLQAAADIPVRRVTRAWAGLRTFAPDRTPVIGYAADTPDFFWFAGQGGYGMQIAPAAARLGAALALREPLPPSIAGVDPGAFAPGRFAP